MPRHLHIKFAPSSVRLYSNDYSLSFALVRFADELSRQWRWKRCERCSRRCNIAETVSLRRRGPRNYGPEENKKGNRAEKQNCRVELRVGVESEAATLYSREIVPWYRKTERERPNAKREQIENRIINVLSIHAHASTAKWYFYNTNRLFKVRISSWKKFFRMDL